jgi:hypothetical protein
MPTHVKHRGYNPITVRTVFKGGRIYSIQYSTREGLIWAAILLHSYEFQFFGDI